jgi:hypothetical protein
MFRAFQNIGVDKDEPDYLVGICAGVEPHKESAQRVAGQHEWAGDPRCVDCVEVVSIDEGRGARFQYSGVGRRRLT